MVETAKCFIGATAITNSALNISFDLFSRVLGIDVAGPHTEFWRDKHF